MTAEAIANELAMRWLSERVWLRARRAQPRPRPVRPSRDDADDILRSIEPADYIGALTGVEAFASGMICCPLPGHDDRSPSFRVYPDAERGWFCFGCGIGGDIFDFAGALWDLFPRRDFPELRRRLARELLRAVG